MFNAILLSEEFFSGKMTLPIWAKDFYRQKKHLYMEIDKWLVKDNKDDCVRVLTNKVMQSIISNS